MIIGSHTGGAVSDTKSEQYFDSERTHLLSFEIMHVRISLIPSLVVQFCMIGFGFDSPQTTLKNSTWKQRANLRKCSQLQHIFPSLMVTR